MYDLIYVGSSKEYACAQKELTERFPNATFEDASDFIHTHRFSIEVDVPVDEYRLALLDLGMPNISLDFQMFRIGKPKEALAFVKQWKAGQDEEETDGQDRP